MDTQLRSLRDLFWMIALANLVSTILAWVSVYGFATSRTVPQTELFWATFQWWTGETIGVLVLTPALLIHVMPHVKRFAEGRAFFEKTPVSFKRPTLQVILQGISIIVAIYLAVEASWPNNFHPYFLIGIPLIWIAIQHGLSGASLGNLLVNFGITWQVQGHHDFNLAELGRLQLMMLVMTLTSLLIGIIVSENKRSEQFSTPEIEKRRKMIAYEWIIVAILAMATWVLEYSYNFIQKIIEWETRNQIEGVDEALATILVLGVASAVFSLRRWREYQVELRKREKAQAELYGMYSDLEIRVKERTADLSKANEYLQVEITERKRAEEGIEKREKRFRALIENNADAIALLDSTGVVVYDSPAAPGMLGYSPDELISQNLFTLLHAEDLVVIQPLFQRLAETPGARSSNIFRIRHKNGSWRWIESIVTNLLAEPSVRAIVANYRDITERKQAEEEVRSRTEELATLYDLSRALAETNDLDTVLDLVNRRTVESIHTTFARIALLEGNELVTRSAYPVRILDSDLFIDSPNSILAMPYCQRVLEQDEPVILRASNPEVITEERAALLLDFAQTLCLIPLRIHDFESNSSRILGLLMIGEARQEEREPFTAEKVRLARSIGDQAAIAIENTRLFNNLQRSSIELSHAYDATIAGWSAALDLRDKETEGHTQRVAEMSYRLAEEMGLGKEELIQVRRGALLHDIGKMGVPDRILLKPDKLTDEEWTIMRMHPSYAFQMLKPITYLRLALDIPYCHHEKWDGTGYPRGLKAEQIPLAARIFCIVDVYDALTSDRPYRKGWSREKTMDHIRELSGSHFDPQVVDAFLKMVREDDKPR